MGRNKVTIDTDHYILYGYDGPCGGYFAQYFDKTSKLYKERSQPSDEIGFFKGVNKNRIIEFFEKHNVVDLARKQTKDAFNNLILDLPC